MEFETIEKRTWKTQVIFSKPIEAADVRFVEKPVPLPSGVDELVRKNWNSELEALKNKSPAGTCEIKPYHKDKSANPLNALYDTNGKLISWPGLAISINGKVEEKPYKGGKTKLLVETGQTSYPFSAAVNKDDIKALYASSGIPLPNPIIGMHTFLETEDSQLLLTVRGNKVRWPNALYAPGGQPETLDVNPEEHQLSEIKDEVSVKKEELTSSIVFSGILLDKDVQPGKPDFSGWVETYLASDDISARLSSKPYEKRQKDVVGIVFAPSSEGPLFDYLTKRVNPAQFVSMTYGGLVLYGLHNFGESWAREVLKRTE